MNKCHKMNTYMTMYVHNSQYGYILLLYDTFKRNGSATWLNETVIRDTANNCYTRRSRAQVS